MTTKAVQVVVTGRVQGVGFRMHVSEEARRLGVAGWVRNEPDGSVAAHLEGAAEAVDELVGWCGTGPAYATVDRVVATDVEATGADGFDVTF